MIFQEVLGRLNLTLGPDGHALAFPQKRQNPDEEKQYFIQAKLLYNNPVLLEEIEESVRTLIEAMAALSDPGEIKACVLAIKSLTAFLDRVKTLADAAEEHNDTNSNLETDPSYAGERGEGS